MKLSEFYGSVKDIAVFPGNLDGLNELVHSDGTNKTYEYYPLSGGQKYIIGILIPQVSDYKEALGLMNISNRLNAEVGLCSVDDMEELTENVGRKADLLFETAEIQDNDIRFKAKKIGADGLIHFQLYSPIDIVHYMGVPVKLKG